MEQQAKEPKKKSPIRLIILIYCIVDSRVFYIR